MKEGHVVVDLADQYDSPLYHHIDESDDPNFHFTEGLASEAIQRDCGHRTAESHVTSIDLYPGGYVAKFVDLFAESGMTVVTNPPVNAVFQGAPRRLPVPARPHAH